MKIYLKKAACNFKWSCESETISDDVIDLVVMMVRSQMNHHHYQNYFNVQPDPRVLHINTIRLNLMIMSKDRCWEL